VSDSTPAIVGKSTAIEEVLAQVGLVARSSATVLITGETGVGKELVAGHIHRHSVRHTRPFVAVNCAGLPETLLESELFGHVKGSFTGAYRDKPGKFEMAHTGTLFLDEVGEMTPRMQGLLLRAVEKGEIQKVGADRATGAVDCRILAATHRDLDALVSKGLFRHDLYYRLNVMRVHVPSLRERPEDIPLLADFFLARHSDQARKLSSEAHAILQAYSWPGNVRQLENVIQRVLISTPAEIITPPDLPAEISREVHISLEAPRRERRRSTAAALRHQIQNGGSFWAVVYEPYMFRDLTRSDVRTLIETGLEEARGNYRALTRIFNLNPSEYKRFMNFLRKHDCLLPFRHYR
jgi:transcriptional regulator with GAF, ATPase, and Fis domain